MRACTFCGSWTAPPESSERMRMPDFFLGLMRFRHPRSGMRRCFWAQRHRGPFLPLRLTLMVYDY